MTAHLPLLVEIESEVMVVGLSSVAVAYDTAPELHQKETKEVCFYGQGRNSTRNRTW